jgi:hypothetical protein
MIQLNLDMRKDMLLIRGQRIFNAETAKYYMYSRSCLLIRGTFAPEMNCSYMVKLGVGIDI